MKALAFVALVLPSLGVALRQEPTLPPADFEGRTERGWIRLRNFANISVAGSGVVTGTATGNPVVLEDTERGMTITGKAMTIRLRPLPGGRYSVDEATVADGARVVFDSETAYKSAVEFATAQSPAPKKPDAFQRMQVDSDSILYRRQADEGVLTIPQAFTLTSDGRGEIVRAAPSGTVRTPFVEHLQFQGSKGRMTVGVTTGVQNGEGLEVTQLRTGRIDGPAKVRLTRTETVPDPEKPGSTKDEITNMNGIADLIEADLDGPAEPQVTATGNVVFEGDNGNLVGRVRGNKAIMTLDATLKPIRYDFTGTPTSTTVRFKDGGR